ncbi:hypothetical protein MHYP_G00088210 [Metynnis hypsauchen]
MWLCVLLLYSVLQRSSDLTKEDSGFYTCAAEEQDMPDIMLQVTGLIIKTLEACKTNATLNCTNNLLNQIDSITDQELPKKDVEDTLKFLIAQQNSHISGKTNQDGLVSSFSRMLNATEKLVSTLVNTVETNSSVSISLENIEVRVFVVGQNSSLKEMLQLHTRHAEIEIDLNGISRNKMNQGHAAVAFMSYTNMSNSSLFSANTMTNTTKLVSAVVSATLPKTNNQSLGKPVNFTLKHLAELNPNYVHSCVYWNETDWVTDGCTRIKTNHSYTVCSSVHLSTFALIMQINPRQSEDRFKAINMVVVSFGLVFLGLALLTFALCRKNPRVINTARINLCISLLLGHLLFLLTQTLVKKKYQLACAVLAGLMHFLFLSAFVWMFIEALMLFLAIKNLSRPKSQHKEVLNWKLLTLVGYMVALTVVGVSAGVEPDGYSSEECWLATSKGFNWSFLGPVFFILASNMILFSLISISLRSSLARLNSQVSQIKQTRTIFFKTMAQFVIFGCPWILGVFTANSEALEIIFLILNSQQGTFIFIVHCVLSKEVRQKYRKLLCRSCVTTYYISSQPRHQLFHPSDQHDTCSASVSSAIKQATVPSAVSRNEALTAEVRATVPLAEETFQQVTWDCCTICPKETWLSAEIPSEAIKATGFSVHCVDRTKDLFGESKWGNVWFMINNAWRDQRNVHFVKSFCSPDLEYLPREIPGVIVTTMYTPPQAGTEMALRKLYEAVNKQETTRPEAAFIVFGDFNKSNFRKVAPKYVQHISCSTQKSHTLDYCYSPFCEAYKTLP